MPKKLLETPDFKSEDEEAAWWAANPDIILREFKASEADGTLGRDSLAKRGGTTPNVSIRLPLEDVQMAKTQAAARGLKYQTYLKSILHQALRAAEAK